MGQTEPLGVDECGFFEYGPLPICATWTLVPWLGTYLGGSRR